MKNLKVERLKAFVFKQFKLSNKRERSEYKLAVSVLESIKDDLSIHNVYSDFEYEYLPDDEIVYMFTDESCKGVGAVAFYHVNHDTLHLCETEHVKRLIQRVPKRQPARRPISLKQRFRILRRDNFTCQSCGASPAKDTTVILEVDHIVTVSNGGTNDDSNLTTKCFDCNRGKSNHFNDS